jgi:hypothetical protein
MESVKLEKLPTRYTQYYKLETGCWLRISAPYIYRYLAGRWLIVK